MRRPAAYGRRHMAVSDVLQAAQPWPFLSPMQAGQALGTQLLRGSHHGYWEEEAIWVEMKVSMTPWLDGSRWLCPLVESELWYNTRLLEDTVGLVLSRWAGCRSWMLDGSWLGMWTVAAGDDDGS